MLPGAKLCCVLCASFFSDVFPNVMLVCFAQTQRPASGCLLCVTALILFCSARTMGKSIHVDGCSTAKPRVLKRATNCINADCGKTGNLRVWKQSEKDQWSAEVLLQCHEDCAAIGCRPPWSASEDQKRAWLQAWLHGGIAWDKLT